MYSLHRVLFVILACALNLPLAAAEPATPAPAKDKFDLYLLIGQSNMAGRGAIEEPDKTAHPRVLKFTKESTWAPGLDPLHFDKPTIAGVGLGTSFGRAMADADPDVTIGLIPCAVGGTPLQRWQEGGDLYKQAVERAKAAMKDGTLKGILWHQGESDSGKEETAKSYGERLAGMVTAFRAKLGTPDVPFVAGELGQYLAREKDGKPNFWPVVNEQLNGLPKSVKQAAVVSSEGLQPKSDQVHFDSASLRTLGKRYAVAMRKLQGGDQSSGCEADATQQTSAKRPNVLLILADDLGFSDLGCYGGEVPTPNLDSLAKTGTRFSSFYTSARCCPSRASLMTGLHPHQAGIGSFANAKPRAGWGPAYTGHLLPTCVTMAEVLDDAGYSTWMVGKWHMGTPGPIERGFQNYFGFKNFLSHSNDQWDPGHYVRLPAGTKPELAIEAKDFYATDVFTDYTLEFLQQAREQKKPYFLYLAHSSPHFPIQAPKESIDKHVATYRQGWDKLREARLVKQKSLGMFPAETKLPPRSMVPVDEQDIANGFSGEPNPAWDSLDSSRQEDLARRAATFAAMVEHVDTGIGKILADLHAHSELDNTLIIFLSDNGACYEWGPFGFDGQSRRGTTTLHTDDELAKMGQAGTHSSYGSGWANLGNTPLNMYKHFCHEGGIASPLIVHWPAGLKQSGGWDNDPAHLMDILPTVLAATGAKYPEKYDNHAITPIEGTSLLSSIDGTPISERSLAFEHQEARGLRRGDWKITWGKRQPTEPTWQLFNLAFDRSEQHNLAAERPNVLSQLVGEWETWAKRVGAEPFQKSDDAKVGSSDDAIESPQIAHRSLRIVATVNAEDPRGVVLAQGGREHGYALHFVEGKPTFDVRVNGKVTRLSATKPTRGKVALTAMLDAEVMTLAITGGESLSMPSPGLIPTQPQDPLSIGDDVRTAAGDYNVPNQFNGEIVGTGVETGKP